MPANIPALAMIALAICNATQVQQPSTALMIAPSTALQILKPSMCNLSEQPNLNRCDVCESTSVQTAVDSSSEAVNSTVAQKQAQRSLSNRKKIKQKNRNHSVAKQCALRKSSNATKPVVQAPQANNRAPVKAFSSPLIAKATDKQEDESPFKVKKDRCLKARNECIEQQTSFPNGDTARGLWSKMYMTPPVKRVINGMDIGLSTLGHAVRCHNGYETCMSQS